MQPITENVYAVPGMSIGRIFLITGRDGLTLVDASLSTKTAEKLEPQLATLGYKLADIQNILITHAHPDHIGGLASLQRHTNARTYIGHRDAAAARGEQPIPRAPLDQLGFFDRLMAMGNMPAPTPARIDAELKEGDTLDTILPGLRVVELFGHSPGQVGYWWPEKRLLIGGDVLMHFPWGLTLPVRAFSVNMQEAQRSIVKAAELAPDILCVGHGLPIIGDAASKIRAVVTKLKI